MTERTRKGREGEREQTQAMREPWNFTGAKMEASKGGAATTRDIFVQDLPALKTLVLGNSHDGEEEATETGKMGRER